MAAISEATAQTQLDAWLAASLAVANNQSYSIGGRTLTRADAATIRDNIEFWEGRVNKAARGGGIKVTGITPT